jgi:hypothetical protein
VASTRTSQTGSGLDITQSQATGFGAAIYVQLPRPMPDRDQLPQRQVIDRRDGYMNDDGARTRHRALAAVSTPTLAVAGILIVGANVSGTTPQPVPW